MKCMIEGRFRPFQSVSAILAIGQYAPIRLIRPDSGRIGPVWRESAREEANPKKEKKKTGRGTDVWVAVSFARRRIECMCGMGFAALVHPRLPPTSTTTVATPTHKHHHKHKHNHAENLTPRNPCNNTKKSTLSYLATHIGVVKGLGSALGRGKCLGQ